MIIGGLMRRVTVSQCVIYAMFFIMPFVVQASQPSLEEGIKQLATDLSSQMEKNNIRKIAVVEFTDLNGYNSALGDFISEELITNLFIVSPKGFDVVERRQLSKVLNEQKLNASGLFNPKTIANIGQILGIQAIVTGSITNLGDRVKINTRLIGVNTAKVFGAASRSIPRDDTVETLMSQNGRQGSSLTQSVTGTSRSNVQRQDVYFKNSFLHISPVSITLSKDMRRLSLSLKIRNLKNENIYMAVEGGKGGGSIISDTGDNIRDFPKVSGLMSISGADYRYKDKNKYYEIEAGSELIAIFTFREGGGVDIDGRKFTFTARFLKYSKGGVKKISVTIPEIQRF